MNTNDFYKELFEKYALDEDKIRRNALKAAKTPAWQRAVSAHWKSAVGAAAAVAVTVGAVAYTAGSPAGDVNIESSENLLSASQRLHAAEQDYYSNSAATEEGMSNIYVTFLDDLCYSDMSVSLSALPDFDDIDIECLYLNDKTVIRGKKEIEEYAETNGSVENIAGAKLYAPLRCYRDICDLSKVLIGELGSEDINDDTFSPIDFDDPDPLNGDSEFIITTALPESTTTPFSFETETSTSAAVNTSAPSSSAGTDAVSEPDLVVPADTGDEHDTTVLPAETEEEDVTEEVTIDPDTTEIIVTDTGDASDEAYENEDTEEASEDAEDAEDDEPEDTEAAEVIAVPDDDSDGVIEVEETDTAETTYVTTTTPAETTISVTEISDAPSVGLMTQIYQLNVENALDTLLIGDNAVVLTRSEVYVYTLGGMLNSPAKVYEISNPKVASSEGNTIVLTGCGSTGRRNTVLAIDLKNGSASMKDGGESLGEAEIGTVNRSSDGKYFMKAVSASTTYIYELNIGDGVSFRPLVEFSGAVSPAGYKFGRLWFTAADDNLKYALYSFDCASGTLSKEYSLGTDCKVRRSKTFESFIISTFDSEKDEGRSYVFNIDSGVLIPADIKGEAMIAVRYGTIYIGQNGSNYTLASDGTLTPTSTQVDYHSMTNSGFAIMSSDSDKVVIAEKERWN